MSNKSPGKSLQREVRALEHNLCIAQQPMTTQVAPSYTHVTYLSPNLIAELPPVPAQKLAHFCLCNLVMFHYACSLKVKRF